MDSRNLQSNSAHETIDPEDFLCEIQSLFHQISLASNHFKDMKGQDVSRLFQNGMVDAIYFDERTEKKKNLSLSKISQVIYNDKELLEKCQRFDKFMFAYSELISENLIALVGELGSEPTINNIESYYDWMIQSFKPISNNLTQAFQAEKKSLIASHANFFFKMANSIINGCVTELIRRVGHILSVKSKTELDELQRALLSKTVSNLSVFSTTGLIINANESVNLFYNNTAKDMLNIVLDRSYNLTDQQKKNFKTQNALTNLGYSEEKAKQLVKPFKTDKKIKIPFFQTAIKDKEVEDLSPKSLAKLKLFAKEKEEVSTSPHLEVKEKL